MEQEICSHCGCKITGKPPLEFDGQVLCAACYEECTTTCEHCGTRVWTDDNAGSRDMPMCDRCYERYYTSCEHCGAIINQNDAYYVDDYPYCGSCHTHMTSGRAIRDYYYKPEPIFFGTSDRYFGVELEIDMGGERESHAQTILEIGNRPDEHIYCKHDGSLDDGFEIVTHPMTLDYHLKTMPWRNVLDEAMDLDYLSHKANTCGLHIHVNRNSLGESCGQQDAAIGRVLYFFEKHWDALLRFSRRTQRQLDRWASRYGYKDQPRELLEHAKKNSYGTRYTCINLQNCDTIEFRIFRGTLRYNTLIATLQLVNRICDLAVTMTDEEIKSMSWPDFVAACDEPELIQYLKERRLYVNEPVDGEEEV